MNKMDKFFNGKRSQNIQQAKNKKKISLIAILCCVAVIILSFILVAVTSIPQGLVVAIVFIAVFVIIYFAIKIKYAKTEIYIMSNLFCKKCGTQFTREDATYEVVKNRTSSRRANGKSANIIVSTYADLIITCECNKCGNKHVFPRSVVIEEKTVTPLNVTVSGKTYDIEEALDKLFNNRWHD